MVPNRAKHHDRLKFWRTYIKETNDLYSKFYAIDFHSNLRVTEYLKIEVTVKKIVQQLLINKIKIVV